MVVKEKKQFIKEIELVRKEVAGPKQEKAEREQASEALQESEEVYRSLVENSVDGIVIVRGRKIVFANKVVKETSGYSEEELKKLDFIKLIAPSYRSVILKRYLARLAGLPVKNQFEIEVLTKEGRTIPCEISSSVVTYQGNKAIQAMLRDITERKRAEEAVRESEKRYRTLFESKLDGMFVIDAETMRIVLANEAAAEMYGFSSVEEVIGVNPLDFVASEEGERTLKIMMVDMFEKDLQEINEFRTITKDGKEKWISAVGARIEYEGKLAGLVSFSDITERKRAEQELRESEVRYRALVEASGQMGEAIVLLQNTDKVEAAHLFANAAWTRITGYTAEELREISYFDLIHPRYRDAVADRNRRRLAGEDVPGPWEISIMAKDGTEVPVEGVGTPITYQGKPAVVAHIRDISQRRKAKEEIEQQRNYFQALFDGSPEAVASLDVQNLIVDINPAFEKLFGYKLEDIKGTDIDDCVVPGSRKEEGKSLGRRALAGEVVAAESVRRRADGREIPVSILTAPIILDGKQIGTFAIYRDITERKKAQEQLEHSFVNLAETVSRAMASRDPYTAGHQRRVAELARLVGEKMGLDKDRLQGLYIGGLLHDIGKVSTPEVILSKPGELADEEWGLIHAHAKQGYRILKDTGLPWPVADMALHHHERLDGSGYPDGISGDEISLEVRILGVCDVVEAMSSHRPYRPARSIAEILRELRSGRGTKYDANVVDIMLEIIEGGEFELSGG